MGSSFVAFHEQGFWVSDDLLQDWLHFLVSEIDATPDRPPWLGELRNMWAWERQIEGSGILDPALDQLETPRQIDTVLNLSAAALKRLDGYGGSIPLIERQRWPVAGEPIGALDTK